MGRASPSVVDHRVRRRGCSRGADERTTASASRPGAPGSLDGALYYLRAAVPDRRASCARFRPDAALVQGVHEAAAFLLARRLARAAHEVDPRRPGRLARGDAPLRLAAARRLLNPLNDALARVRRPRARTRSARCPTQTPGSCARSASSRRPCSRRTSTPRRSSPARRRRCPSGRARVFVGVLERYKALRHARRRVAPRRAARAGARPARRRRRDARASARPSSSPSCRRRRSGRARLDAEECRAAMDAALARLPAVALGGAAARRARGDVPRPRDRRRRPRPASPTSSTTARTDCSSTPTTPEALADALVAHPLRPAERASGSAPPRARTGEELGVDAASSTRRSVAALVRSATSSRANLAPADARADQAGAEELRLPRDRRDRERARRRQRRRPHAARPHVPQGQRPAEQPHVDAGLAVRRADGAAARSSATSSSTSTRCSRHYLDGAPLPDGAVLITFDDGYRDNLLNAAPVLRSHGYPAVQFVPIAYVGDRSRCRTSATSPRTASTTRPSTGTRSASSSGSACGSSRTGSATSRSRSSRSTRRRARSRSRS